MHAAPITSRRPGPAPHRLRRIGRRRLFRRAAWLLAGVVMGAALMAAIAGRYEYSNRGGTHFRFDRWTGTLEYQGDGWRPVGES